MTKELSKKKFDYSQVDKETKSTLIYYAGEIQKQGVKHAESGLEMGRMLSEAREQFSNKKAFEEWVESECGHGIRTAYRYMAAFENFGGCVTVTQIELSAMYELASNDKAKKKALKLTEKGITVTQSLAKKLVKDASKSSSDQGEPGGGSPASIEPAPVASGPASDATAASEPDPFDVDEDPFEDGEDDGETDPEPPPRNGKENGQGNERTPEEEFKIQRSKTVKTVEALMRAFCDLNRLRVGPRDESVETCKSLLETARNWGE